MAKVGDLKFGIDKFFLQTRINVCSTIHCANRKLRELECNLKEIDIEDGKCKSLIPEERQDIFRCKSNKETKQ